MIVGHYVIRTYRKFKNQGIGTRFVIVGIPLVPIQSFYIFKDTNRTIEIDLYWKQAVKVYFIMASIIYLLAKYFTRDYYDMAFEKLFSIVLIINLMVYFLLDSYTKKDRQIRELLSRSVYINALPKFLGSNVAFSVQKGFIENFKERFGINWKDLVKNKAYTDEHLPFLFPILVYDCYLYDNEATEKFFQDIFHRYKTIENIT